MGGGRRGKTELVEVGKDIDRYRYSEWDPYTLTENDLLATTLRANEEGHHLWDSSEQLQAYGTATWMAGSRQIIANTLVNTAQKRSGSTKIPAVQANVALANYQEARKWLAFRDEVSVLPDYEIAPSMDVTMPWPDPKGDIPQDLIYGLKSVVEQLYYIQHPKIDFVVNDSYIKAAFRGYKNQLAKKGAELQARIASIDRIWNDTIDTNTPLGVDIYTRLVEATEGLLAFGVNELVPVTLRSDLKLLKREKEDPDKLPNFDPRSIGKKAINAPALSATTPTLPPLDPASLRRKEPRRAAAEAAALPPFNSNTLHRKKDTSQSHAVPGLPTFNPAILRQASSRMAKTLPTFDASKMQNFHPDQEQDERGLPPFDPNALRRKR